MHALRRIIYSSCLVLAAAQVGGDEDASTQQEIHSRVAEAIAICRERLEVDPHFPKLQLSLAQLIDSQLSHSDSNDVDLVGEVLGLYNAVGLPNAEVAEARIPPARVRFESLTRAGTIARDVLNDAHRAIEYYSLAMKIDDIDDSSLLLAFRTVMPILISSVRVDRPSHIEISWGGVSTADAPAEQRFADLGFDLCDIVETKCPTESIVDEYRGALHRRMKQPELAYKSYLRATVTSRQNMNVAHGRTNRTLAVEDFVRTSILAAAAGREAGETFERQMSYLNDAEEVGGKLLAMAVDFNQSEEKLFHDSLREQMVDLYNNMGIAEKKLGSRTRAQMFFKKALEINPSDGHALVQLASINDDGESNDIVSNVKELDRAYVSDLFDGYSTRFESELLDVLHYTGHSLVFSATQSAVERLGLHVKKMIDLGCGTGLLGELVSKEMPWVKVIGVDLSERMVEISRARKNKRGGYVYTSVVNEDAAQFVFTLEERSVECIVASDVFIYVGDVSKLLRGCAMSLIEGGIVTFTVEGYEDPKGGDGVRLLPSGRFGHSRSYVNGVASGAGFEVFSWEDCVLRQQAGEDVYGAVVVLRKVLETETLSKRN